MMFSRSNNGRAPQAAPGPLSINQGNVGTGNRARSDKFKPQGPGPRTVDAAPAKQTVGFSVAPAHNERLLYALLLLVGRKIEVQVKSGAVYEGVFFTANFEAKDMHIVLRLPKVVKEPPGKSSDRQKLAEKPPAKLIIYSNDIVGFVAHDVEERYRGEDALETDGDISRGKAGIVGRELQPWVPDTEDGFELGLDGGLDSYAPGWDQFAVNQQMFGVESTWDESFYTTILDKSKSKISETVAEKIAREIERGNLHSNNIHVLEERGLEVDDSGIDEEDKYSSVIRDSYASRQGPGPLDKRPSGSHTSRSSENGSSKVPAWSSHGAGVAAVAGRHMEAASQPLPPAQQLQPQLPAPAMPLLGQPVMNALSSAPIDIEIRKETNRIRSTLAGPKKTSSSPAHGTPKGLKSPLISPLISNPELVEALDLHPGSTKVDREVVQEFLEFKKNRQSNAAGGFQEFKKTRQSITPEYSKKEVHDLKASAERIRLAPKPDDHTSLASLASMDGLTPPTTPSVQAAQASGPAGSSMEASQQPSTPAQDISKPATDGSASASKPGSKDGAMPSEGKESDSLSAHKSSFKFNINAKEFVPSFGGASSSTGNAPAPAVATVVATPPPVPKPTPPPAAPSSTVTKLPVMPMAVVAHSPIQPVPMGGPSLAGHGPPSGSSVPVPTPPPAGMHHSGGPGLHRGEQGEPLHHPAASTGPMPMGKVDRGDHSYSGGPSSSLGSAAQVPREPRESSGPSFHPPIALGAAGAMHPAHMNPMAGQFAAGFMGPAGFAMQGSIMAPHHGMMPAPIMGSHMAYSSMPGMARVGGPHGAGPYFTGPPFMSQFHPTPYGMASPAAGRMYPNMHFAMAPTAGLPMPPADAMTPHDRPHGPRNRPHRQHHHMGMGGPAGMPGGGPGMREFGGMRPDSGGMRPDTGSMRGESSSMRPGSSGDRDMPGKDHHGMGGSSKEHHGPMGGGMPGGERHSMGGGLHSKDHHSSSHGGSKDHHGGMSGGKDMHKAQQQRDD